MYKKYAKRENMDSICININKYATQYATKYAKYVEICRNMHKNMQIYANIWTQCAKYAHTKICQNTH